jgi:hypothetical protein
VNGLALCRAYFFETAHASLLARFGDISTQLAVGLSGPGSDCFGYDDDISQDHDWGPGFCLFIPDRLFSDYSAELSAWYDELPKSFRGFGPRFITEDGRIGVIHLERFFAMYSGLRDRNASARQWLLASTEGLAVCTNGEVFMDDSGEFSEWRTILSRYPEDVRRKKIASSCFLAGQSGQYNYMRSKKRGDVFASAFALSQFCSQALSLAFLLANRFSPYYKWKLRAAKELPPPYNQIAFDVEDILRHSQDPETRIEALAADIIIHLTSQGLTVGESDFLADHKASVEQGITDPQIRDMPGLY